MITSEFTFHFIKHIQYKNLDFQYLQYIIPLIRKKSNTAIAKNKKMGYNNYNAEFLGGIKNEYKNYGGYDYW